MALRLPLVRPGPARARPLGARAGTYVLAPKATTPAVKGTISETQTLTVN